MKTIRIVGLNKAKSIQIDWSFSFSIWKVKRLTFDIPDWADDTCVATYDMDDNDIPPIIKYYKGCKVFYIPLPKCKKVVEVYHTPLYDRKKGWDTDGRPFYSSNRVIIVDVFN